MELGKADLTSSSSIKLHEHTKRLIISIFYDFIKVLLAHIAGHSSFSRTVSISILFIGF